MGLLDAQLTSDSPTDQIVLLDSGSFTIANNTFDNITLVSHALPFTPLPILLWSNTSDFAITNTGMDLAMALSSFGSAMGQQYSPSPTANSIGISRTNTSGSSQTVYWRLYAFAPSTAPDDAVVAATAHLGGNAILNTYFNYMKLLHKGALTPSSPSYTHSLGYVPRVLVWGDGDPIVSSQLVPAIPGATTGVVVDENSITWVAPSTYSAIEYRIYVEPQ